MTNEEAIRTIERIIDDNGLYGTSPLAPHAITALETAISALVNMDKHLIKCPNYIKEEST